MENYRHHQKANESSLHTCSIEVFFHYIILQRTLNFEWDQGRPLVHIY
jgi:hypothetical protein